MLMLSIPGFAPASGPGVGSARIQIRIDIGFGDAIQPPPLDARYPTLLEGSPQPWIRAYPPEAVVAEKLHAMVVLGDQNSRYKDFYDLYSIARHVSFTGERLAGSISTTFDRRHTAISPDLPQSLTPQFYAEPARADQWRAYLIRSSLPGVPDDFRIVGDLIQVVSCRPMARTRTRLRDHRRVVRGWPLELRCRESTTDERAGMTNGSEQRPTSG